MSTFSVSEFTARCANTSGCRPYSNERAGVRFGNDDLEIVAASGCELISRTGQKYIDFSNAFGSILLGHADPDVNAAVIGAIGRAVPAGASGDMAVGLSARLSRDLGGSYQTAWFKTGTAAVRAAALAARRATGRSLIVSAGFHGWDPMWAPNREPFTVNQDGVYDFFYCVKNLERCLNERAHEVAALVLSPDYLHYSPASLSKIIALARAAGVMIVMDEVKYGYRFGVGPSIARYQLAADVYVYAKGLANGWPLAVVVGPDAFMNELRLFASTLTYEVPSMAAADATLRKSESVAAQASIATNGRVFVEACRQLFARAGLPLDIAGDGTCFQFVAENAELEAGLLSTARSQGLVFQPGDQQLPSYAFRGDIVYSAIDKMEAVVRSLMTSFGAMRGIPISERARWEAAWMQMDGLADAPSSEQARHDFLVAKLAG